MSVTGRSSPIGAPDPVRNSARRRRATTVLARHDLADGAGETPRVSNADRWGRMNDALIAEFRRARGNLPRRRNPVLLLTTTGARTGRERVVPLNYTTDGDRLVVIASSGGAARHPAWYGNLVANPLVTIEVAGERFRARATSVDEPERTRLYDRQAEAMPFFDGYRRRVRAREIPVVVFERLAADDG
jgi:deazaflavin-dependent oxidoreductase (nitroreductase family)